MKLTFKCFIWAISSERIWKRRVEKKTLSEARYINLSLHFLEQVVVKLSNPIINKTHIPYRNSMMTSILRDSLGGNCFTAMIANVVLNRQCIAVSLLYIWYLSHYLNQLNYFGVKNYL